MVHNLRITIGEESVGANHVSRAGWTVDGCNYQLGEYPLSWAYGGTAKFSTDSKFTDFSVKFYKNDCVTCYLVITTTKLIALMSKLGLHAVALVTKLIARLYSVGSLSM